MDIEGIIKFKVGQAEPLTTRLHGLIRDYPKGVSIAKEFIQNADDAGAKRVEIVLDWRTHPSERLPAPTMAKLSGPALLIFNDRPFSDEDFESIQRIGQSAKVQTPAKTGRFGLGFNAAYNVTDYPSYLSRGQLSFFDPHLDVIPDATPTEPGGGWKLTPQLWEQFPDLLLPYTTAGLAELQNHFEGTIFRLPLRTAAFASKSKISADPFTEDDFRQIVNQLSGIGDDLLIFLKHVLSVQVLEIPVTGDKDRRALLEITTENAEEVAEHRRVLVDAVSGSHEELLGRLREETYELPQVLYRHSVRVRTEADERITTWLVSSGLYAGAEQQLIDAADQMLATGEKAVPWAGVAAKLTGSVEGLLSAETVPGRAYCFLPLSVDTTLPVHVNGFFDLDSSRHTLTAEPLVGSSQVRVHWNKMLVEHGVAPAYAEILRSMPEQIDPHSVEAFYALWPDGDVRHPDIFAGLPKALYAEIADSSVIRAADSQWTSIEFLWIPPKDSVELQEALVAAGFLVPDPPLPDHVEAGLRQAGAQVDALTPSEVRRHLRRADDVNLPLEEVTNAGLRRREWVVALLKFSLRDASGGDLSGLPLALLADGKLHTFGKSSGGSIFIANTKEREIFSLFPHWFIDEEFATACSLSAFPDAKLLEMKPVNVVANLKAMLKQGTSGTLPTWEPDGARPPNAEWLSKVYRYLANAGQDQDFQPQEEKFSKLPIVPDQYHQLHSLGTTTTPLVIAAESDGVDPLREVLEAFKVPIVTGPPELLHAIQSFMDAFPDRYIWRVTGRDLVDTLHAVATAGTPWPDYNPGVHNRLIDFLADPKWADQYEHDGEKRLAKLAELRIFPTTVGTLISIDDDAYVPDDYSPPPIAGEVSLLKTGQGRRWRTLLKSVGARTLDRQTFIEEVLIPNYAKITPEKQREALQWVRNHLNETETKISNAGGDPLELRRTISNAPLVRCTDGELHPIASTYDPAAEIVQAVLGKQAWIPDMAFYGQGEGLWLDFFKHLGVASSPRPQDLLRHIDELISTALKVGTTAVRKPLRAVLEHVIAHWERIADEPMSSTDGETITFAIALRERAWLPAQTDQRGLRHDLGYRGFVAPEDRLYRASELELPDNADLASSQRPIAAISHDLPLRIRNALKFPLHPPPAVVVAHFDRLLELWESRAIEEERLGEFKNILRRIYRYFGEIDFEGIIENSADELSISWFQEHYANRPCIWDWDRGGFWFPRHAFRQTVEFFGERRRSINVETNTTNDAFLNKGLDRLGRRNAPMVEDYIEFLEELGAHYNSSPLPNSELQNVVAVLRRLESALIAEAETVADILVPTSDGSLVRSSRVFLADAPWFQDALAGARIHLLHPEVPDTTAELTGIARLSKSVEERPVGEFEVVSGQASANQCDNWQTILQSPEFAEGLVRLVRDQRNVDLSGQLGWLGNATVIPVRKINVELFVERDGSAERMANSEVDFYHQDPDNVFYLKSQPKRFMVNFLADAVNRRLEKDYLRDRSLLVEILDTAPTDIHELLNKFRVPTISIARGQRRDDADEEAEHAGVVFLEEDWIMPKEEENEDADALHDGLEISWPDQVIGVDEPGIDSSLPPQRGLSPSKATTDCNVDLEIDHQNTPAFDREQQLGTRTPFAPNSSVPSGHPSAEKDTSSDRAPTTPGHGRSASARAAKAEHSRQDRVITYVAPIGQDTFSEEDLTDDEHPSNEALGIGTAAVERVLAFEEAAGREAESMPHNNPGYDVASREENNELRYIEVKGIDGPWADRGVPLSPRQFNFAQQYGEQFWLYVVEFARDDGRAKVHPIRNPAGRINQFRFDSGWRHLVEGGSGAAGPIEPQEGSRILLTDREGVIEKVHQHGTLSSIDVRLADGSLLANQLFNPIRMTVLSPPDIE